MAKSARAQVSGLARTERIRGTLLAPAGRADDRGIVNAARKYVLPGAIDVHTHVEMPFMGTYTADDFRTGSLDRVSAVGTVSRSREISSCSRVLSV
jgi:dihydroorotase-like cyclic amidohydrolase